MQVKFTTTSIALLIFLIVSFWSSGVMLIRLLSMYQVWGSSALTILLFLVSIPLVILSMVSVNKLLRVMQVDTKRHVYCILAGVLLVHGVLLSSYPEVYALTSSLSLSAAGWLLWFGGVAVLVIGCSD
jgi:hypothetical protein